MSAVRILPARCDSRAALAFAAVGLLLHGWRLIAGPDGAIRFHDAFDSEYPRLAVMGRQLVDGTLSHWYPSIAGGMPAAAYHFHQLDPLVLIGGLVPAWALQALLMGLTAFVSGWGMYLFARRFLDAAPAPAAIAGALFLLQSQSGTLAFMAFGFHFPLVFVLLHGTGGGLSQRLKRGAAAAALGLIAYPILTLPAFPLLHGLLLLALKRHSWRDLAAAALFWAGMGLDFLPAVAVLLEYLSHVQRGYAAPAFAAAGDALVYGVTGLPLLLGRHLLSLPMAPLLAGAAVVGLARLPRLRRLLAVVAVVLVLWTLAVSPLHSLLAGSFLQKIDLAHLGLALPPAITMAVAAALVAARDAPDLARRFLTAALVALLAGPALTLAWWSWAILAVAFTAAALAAAPAAPWRLPGPDARWSAAILFGLALALRQPAAQEPASFRQLLPTDDPALALVAAQQARLPSRVALAWIHPAAGQLAGLDTFGGRSPLFDRRYKELAGLALAPQLDSIDKRDAFAGYWYQVLLTESGRTPARLDARDWDWSVLAAMNVAHVVAPGPIAGAPLPPLLTPADSGGRLWVYPVPAAFPRVWLAAEARILADRAAVLGAIAAAPLALSQTVLFAAEDAPPTLPRAPGGCGEARLTVVRPDRLEIAVEVEAPCWLVTAINAHPRWQAVLDGQAVPVTRADHAFMAVPIATRGRHEISLFYSDSRTPWLLGLSPLGALLMVLAVVVGRGKWPVGSRRR